MTHSFGEFDGVGYWFKVFVDLCVTLPRMAGIVMVWVGGFVFLETSTTNTELLVNAVAMTYALKLDGKHLAILYTLSSLYRMSDG